MRQLLVGALTAAILTVALTGSAVAHHRDGHRNGHGHRESRERDQVHHCVGIVQQLASAPHPVLVQLLVRDCLDEDVREYLTDRHDRLVVVPGGVVILDDHEHPSCRGLRRAVERSTNLRVAILAAERGCD